MGAGKTVEDWDAWTARMKAAHGNGNGHGKSLSIETQRLAVADLLPTPTATDHKASGASYAATDTHHAGTTLTDATVRQPERFGQYAPAIARWEAILGRPAPAPTEPTGRDGAHRLSPRFVEFLMGLDDGWVTDVGLTRNEQLKALGNGVVPQQAVAALRRLLAIREMARSGVAA
jgi:DNA (cytosine-5)-methyltransferase 1